MKTLTTAELRARLEELFPNSATSWRLATDEVRDMCRHAREMRGVDEEGAVDFRKLTTPKLWNTVGCHGVVSFYDGMTPDEKAKFCEDWSFLHEEIPHPDWS
jgi:hypothetical protein